MEYLFIIAVGLLAFFLFSLSVKQEKAPSDRIFISWIVLLLINETAFILYVQGKTLDHAPLISFIHDTHILHAPILYLYIKAFTTKHFTFQWKQLLHLLIVCIPLVSKYLVSRLNVYSYDINRLDINLNSTYNTLMYLYKYIIVGLYVRATYKLVQAHKEQVSTPREALRNLWLRQLLNGTFMLFGGIVLIQLLRLFLPVLLYDRMAIMSTFSNLFIIALLYLFNSQSFIFNAKTEKTKANELVNYATYTDEEKDIVNRLIKFVTDTKIYLDSTITIKTVAESIEIPQRTLSQSINNVTENSFTHFINKYRVAHLKSLLKDESKRQYTIISLAEESGFSSKSTLVRIFKQHTGCTPSEYLNKIKS